MTNDTATDILVVAAILASLDSLVPKARYVWKFFVWLYKKLPNIDQPPITLHIPPPARPAVTAPRPEDTIIRLSKAFEKAKHVDVTDDHPSKRVMRTPEAPDPVVTHPGTQLGATSPDGVTKVLKRNISCPNQGQLVAWETTRIGLDGIHYLVMRYIPGEQQPRYKLTPNKNEANDQWFTWYDEIKKANGNAFGGCSGTGIGGERPF